MEELLFNQKQLINSFKNKLKNCQLILGRDTADMLVFAHWTVQRLNAVHLK